MEAVVILANRFVFFFFFDNTSPVERNVKRNLRVISKQCRRELRQQQLPGENSFSSGNQFFPSTTKWGFSPRALFSRSALHVRFIVIPRILLFITITTVLRPQWPDGVFFFAQKAEPDSGDGFVRRPLNRHERFPRKRVKRTVTVNTYPSVVIAVGRLFACARQPPSVFDRFLLSSGSAGHVAPTHPGRGEVAKIFYRPPHRAVKIPRWPERFGGGEKMFNRVLKLPLRRIPL